MTAGLSATPTSTTPNEEHEDMEILFTFNEGHTLVRSTKGYLTMTKGEKRYRPVFSSHWSAPFCEEAEENFFLARNALIPYENAKIRMLVEEDGNKNKTEEISFTAKIGRKPDQHGETTGIVLEPEALKGLLCKNIGDYWLVGRVFHKGHLMYPNHPTSDPLLPAMQQFYREKVSANLTRLRSSLA